MTEIDVKSPQQNPSDQPKQPDSTNQDHDPSHFAPQGPSGQPFPPPNFAFYTYPPSHPPPPPADGTNPDSNASPTGNGEPIPYPPGMYPYVYHQPPPPGFIGYMPVSMSGMPIPSAIIKPKRKQVKMACTNCAAACKRCDINRPCERCIKYGLSDSCHDGVRKERKKGFKRGPYNKRKRQEEREVQDWEGGSQANPNAEWTPGSATAPFPPPPQAPFPPPPEGYYPAFYALGPPPPGPGPHLVAVPHNGAPGEHPDGQPDGTVDPNQHNGENGQPPHGQPPFPPHPPFVYPHLPPGAYPHFGYPFPGPPQQPPSQQQPPPLQQSPPEQQQSHTTTVSQQGQALENAQEQAQQDQISPALTQSQAPQSLQQPPNNNNTSTIVITSKKARASTGEEVLKEDDDDEDEDPPTPPKKKRGRRPSDGDWPGATNKRKPKAENGGPARRSTRRAQVPSTQEEDLVAELQSEHTQITETITDQDIVGSSENPVVQR
ncbi:hypothetical protein Clacol_009215 [Clathrus columnatus]|uniref:Zn(2)-C6 fungal-type domain-containing protein n=1 Tax=Clathrus columnatus TaxID=1419009 RepID=A0AAV5AQ51_9AGAM|nr:hypothetical protein Clacol_009215 [Clathrus columnatus]